MKSILNKIYLHPIFLITVFLFILLGRFRIICYFMILISIHEVGHIITGLFFKWRINKIIVLPFGCLTKFDIDINTDLFSEFIVSISGVLIQSIFYIIIRNKISYYYFDYINYFIIIFNLLPIYPLDGSKILSVCINKLTSFYKSMYILSYVSFISIFLMNIVLFSINKLVVFISLFLIIETLKTYKNISNVFNKFLLERYLKKYKFKRSKTIKNVYEMRRGYRHIFYIDNKYVTEYSFLSKMFDFKRKV